MDTKIFCFSVITVALMFAGPSQSFADFKTYAGSACQRWSDPVDPPTYLDGSRRFNSSPTNKLRLDCPAVHDRYGRILQSLIRVVDNDPNDGVCARIVAVSYYGTSVLGKTGPRKCTSIAHADYSAVQLDTGPLDILHVFAHYYFSVDNIPKVVSGGASGVASYFVREEDGNDK